MPFASDAQRKHFFANNGGGTASSDALIEQRMDHEEFTNADASAMGINVRLPQMTEAEKVDWAAWRGDFSKK